MIVPAASSKLAPITAPAPLLSSVIFIGHNHSLCANLYPVFLPPFRYIPLRARRLSAVLSRAWHRVGTQIMPLKEEFQAGLN